MEKILEIINDIEQDIDKSYCFGYDNNEDTLDSGKDSLKHLKKQLMLGVVSNRREQLEAFVKQIKEDNELTEEINFQDINKFLASNCS